MRIFPKFMSDTKTTYLVSLEINAKQKQTNKKTYTEIHSIETTDQRLKKILKEARGNKIQFICRNHESKRGDE